MSLACSDLRSWQILIRLLLASLVLVLCGGRALAELPEQLRVMTYNIHHAEGSDRRIDLGRIAEVLNNSEADIIALQEVDQGTQRTDRIDMPAELARRTGTTAIFGRNIDYQGGGYGTLVLTRLPVLRSQLHALPSHDGGEQRGVQVVELDFHRTSIVLFATHLDHGADESERLASVKKINSLLVDYGKEPMILMGDLNAEPASLTMRAVTARLGDDS